MTVFMPSGLLHYLVQHADFIYYRLITVKHLSRVFVPTYYVVNFVFFFTDRTSFRCDGMSLS